MGLLNNKDWSDACKRTIAKTTVKCSVVDIRDVEGKEGKPDATFISLRTESDVKDTAGDTLAAGYVFDVALNTSANPANDPKLDTMNRISKERFRELVVAALNLPPATKDAATEFEQAGGVEAVKGKVVLVDVAPSKLGNQNVNRFSRVPA